MGDYYAVHDALVDWDTVKANHAAQALQLKADSLPFNELKGDTSIILTAKNFAVSISSEMKGFIGEDSIEHTPKNEKVTVNIGDAFDIAAEHNQANYRRISDRVGETDYEVKLRNHKKEAVEIVVLDHLFGDWEITHSSVEYKKVSANKVEFHVTAEPEHEVSITYTVRTSS